MFTKGWQVVEQLEKKAPQKFAFKGDNVGLQVGCLDKEVKRCLITLDITANVLEEAIDREVDLIISHHPLIYEPVSKIEINAGTGYIISRAIKNNLNIYSAHTNLDVAPEIGVNSVLAEKLGLTDTGIIYTTHEGSYFKLVVFVPRGYEEQVRKAVCEKGAGWVGKYSNCTFLTEGTGTFKPLEGTMPFEGSKGKESKVREYRLETIVPEDSVPHVLEQVNSAHPYEEVAYDIYPVENLKDEYGLGLIGNLITEMNTIDFIEHVKDKLNLKYLGSCGKQPEKINKVALCGGSGEKLIDKAFLEGADVYITGDIKYHPALEAMQSGYFVLDAGHFATERPLLESLKKYLEESFSKNYKTEFFVSNNQIDPFEIR